MLIHRQIHVIGGDNDDDDNDEDDDDDDDDDDDNDGDDDDHERASLMADGISAGWWRSIEGKQMDS